MGGYVKDLKSVCCEIFAGTVTKSRTLLYPPAKYPTSISSLINQISLISSISISIKFHHPIISSISLTIPTHFPITSSIFTTLFNSPISPNQYFPLVNSV
ncbi:hypothetical protein MRGR3_0235 [Staphylococcus aureus subsp. aureus MRGR3]|nr:hypothetical protein MRGR3_0235 [Staphylococcus aureus subsp. aureus MRGR3]